MVTFVTVENAKIKEHLKEKIKECWENVYTKSVKEIIKSENLKIKTSYKPI